MSLMHELTVVCDGCGDEQRFSTDREDQERTNADGARRLLHEIGWVSRRQSGHHTTAYYGSKAGVRMRNRAISVRPCVPSMTAVSPTRRSSTMSKFRKKPVVIEAHQWTLDEHQRAAIVQWIRDGGHEGVDETGWLRKHSLAIQTLEGTMIADPGDWIIRGVAGEFYPCKPDIFEATYEEAPDAD